MVQVSCSLAFPGLPIANTRKRKIQRKTRRPGLFHHVNDIRWMWGGRREEGPNRKNSALDHPFKWSSYHSSGLKTLVWSKLLIFTGKKLAFWIYSYWISGPPPYVHLASTHVMNEPRPSPFFAILLLPCIILNAKQRMKNGEGLGMRLSQLYHGFLGCMGFVPFALLYLFPRGWPSGIHNYTRGTNPILSRNPWYNITYDMS